MCGVSPETRCAMTPDSSEQGPEVIAAEATRARSLAVIEKGTPLPAFRGAEMSEALTAYRELQRALDHAMPDQIMELDGKPFRKKGYWRAIAVAFNLRVECVTESEEVDGVFQDSRPNFGWHVVYRAMASNGRAATGDGSCFAVEKAKRRGEADPWAALPRQAPRHNVRSHAHTRAYNRAVSNLVGFGEVSAEEVDRDNVDDERPAGMDAETLRKWLGYAMTEKGGGWTKEQIVTLLGTYNATNAAGVPEADRPAVVASLKRPPPVTDEHHASFDEKERKAFFAALTDLNVNYDDLKAYTAAHDDPKPSSMLPDQRAALLTMLRSDKGMADFRAFVSVPAK